MSSAVALFSASEKREKAVGAAGDSWRCVFGSSPATASAGGLYIYGAGWRAGLCSGASADQDVVDRDVHELDEEADETHHEEAHGRGAGDARELCG